MLLYVETHHKYLNPSSATKFYIKFSLAHSNLLLYKDPRLQPRLRRANPKYLHIAGHKAIFHT